MVPIRGSNRAWKVAGPEDPPDKVQDRVITLEIQGDDANGYHLVMSPAGCFTADTWHENIEDAKETAAEAFGLPRYVDIDTEPVDTSNPTHGFTLAGQSRTTETAATAD